MFSPSTTRTWPNIAWKTRLIACRQQSTGSRQTSCSCLHGWQSVRALLVRLGVLLVCAEPGALRLLGLRLTACDFLREYKRKLGGCVSIQVFFAPLGHTCACAAAESHVVPAYCFADYRTVPLNGTGKENKIFGISILFSDFRSPFRRCHARCRT